MGRTKELKPATPFLTKDAGTTDGAVAGRVAGTYFHGLFENADFTRAFLTKVAESRRLEWRPPQLDYSKDKEYDKLAEVARQHLDIPGIHKLLESE
jgi:adenosylcobyric acid synthase